MEQEIKKINTYLEVEGVKKGSIAEELGLKTGDRIIRINGQSLRDFIDYKFLVTDTYLEVEVITLEGDKLILEIEKDFDEELGIDFSDIIFDGLKTCNNNCIFCFINQAPPEGGRKSLYLKDDDYRFSFLEGSYITLTNLMEAEFNRIKRLHLSPLNISVHSTDPEVRKKMLNNEQAGKILERIKDLIEAGIKLNTQVVLCPGINDGEYLEKTIEDLGQFAPQIKSLAIVPVGLTRYREGLHNLRSFTSREAQNIVELVERKQEEFKEEAGMNFVYLADEFYFLAEDSIPAVEAYDSFPQLENGVGMTRLFWDQFTSLKEELPKETSVSRQVSIVTGKLGKKVLNPVKRELNKIEGLKINLIEVKNNYFGSMVTVTGLLTGEDILREITRHSLGELVLIPELVLNDDELFLDNLTWAEFREKVPTEVKKVKNDARELVNAILQLKEVEGVEELEVEISD